MTNTTKTRILSCALIAMAAACGESRASSAKAEGGGIAPRKMTDALFAVLSADRTVYTQKVVNRLQGLKVIKATEHFEDDRTLPLPAQMFRMGGEIVQKGDHGFTYALISQWPINKQNAPVTQFEKGSLAAMVSSGAPIYGEETLGGKRYFTAIYPDKAVSEACVSCHNENADSPRTDFELGDVMGGVVIRVAL
jgi:hypothetical protein